MTLLGANENGDAIVRVIAGRSAGIDGPGSTHTPIAIVARVRCRRARASLPWDPAYNALIYVLAGQGASVHDRAPSPRASWPCTSTATTVVTRGD